MPVDAADFFRRKAIATLARELPAETQDRLREEIRSRRLPVADQLALLTEACMEHYKEPEFLWDRAALLALTSGEAIGGSRAEFRARHGKDAASGRDA